MGDGSNTSKASCSSSIFDEAHPCVEPPSAEANHCVDAGRSWHGSLDLDDCNRRVDYLDLPEVDPPETDGPVNHLFITNEGDKDSSNEDDAAFGETPMARRRIAHKKKGKSHGKGLNLALVKKRPSRLKLAVRFLLIPHPSRTSSILIRRKVKDGRLNLLKMKLY